LAVILIVAGIGYTYIIVRKVVTRTWLWPKESQKGSARVQAAVAARQALQRFPSEDAERVAGNKMALNAERIVDGGLNGQEALR
jgi:hypothetical protein